MRSSPIASQNSTWATRLPDIVAGVSLGIIVVSAVFWAAAPIASDDLWWHLSLGELFRAQGPWASPDPLLFAAVDPPIPHSWFFDMLVSVVDQSFGLAGLRVFHAVAVLLIIVLAYAIFRRGLADRALALAGTAIFVSLAADRLIRMRPDLLSIGACLLLYLLLLAEDSPPSRRRVAASIFVMWFWANSHALFAVGPILLGVGLCAWFAAPLLRQSRRFSPQEWLWVTRLTTAIGLGLLAALLNPRGIDQVFTFLRSAESKVLWAVRDDWTPFNPFLWEPLRGAMPFSTWVIADATLVAFVLLAIFLCVRILRRPEVAPWSSLHPPLFGLAVASLVAIAASSRFLWMAIFPILWLLRCLPSALPNFSSGGLKWSSALLCAVLLLAFPNLGMLGAFTSGRLNWYLEQDVKTAYPSEGVHFLRQTEMEGNLFARYSTSGFIGYWLEPRIKTLVNASMNFPADVFEDYFAIVGEKGVHAGERYTDVLDRREIDLYFGFGTPTPSAFIYSTPDLEAEPAWLLVHRGLDHAIYQRDSPRNLKNLERAVNYYAQNRVPFDPMTGLDIGRVLRDHTQWAIEHRMLPIRYHELFEARSGSPNALNNLGIIHLLLGDYAAQIEFDRELVSLVPNNLDGRRRLAYGLLKLGRADEALAHARTLKSIDEKPIADQLLRLAERKLAIDRDGDLSAEKFLKSDAWRRDLNSLHIVTDRQHKTILRSMISPLLLRARLGE
jgi:tetratricopeptide (TPR) repeat protein